MVSRKAKQTLIVFIAFGLLILLPPAVMAAPPDQVADSAVSQGTVKQMVPMDDSGHVTPDGVVVGDCGQSWLYLFNAGSKSAGFIFGADSNWGPMAYVSYTVTWKNWSQDTSGSFGGSAWPVSSTWGSTREAFTGTGTVTAVMTGYVVTPRGPCSINYPGASTVVS